MPASMMRGGGAAGGRENVVGNRIASVATGPMPGSTPTRVPMSAPIRQKRTLIGVRATENPRTRLFNRSMGAPGGSSQRPQLHRQGGRIDEERPRAGSQRECEQ